MARFIVRRLLYMIPMLIGITLLAFILVKLSPGDFLQEMRHNPQIPKEYIEQMEREFGLNLPWWQQYGKWLSNIVLHLNFGTSFAFKVPVWDLISQRLCNTLILSVAALLFTWLLAVPLGVWAATRRGSLADKIITVCAYTGSATPSFFLALLVVFWAANWYGVLRLPVGGMTSITNSIMSPGQQIMDVLRHLILPALTLGVLGLAGMVRQVRASVLDVLHSDYVTTARAKGLSEHTVIWRHVVRNALNPLITLFGFELGGLLSGALFIEIVMGWPGLGRLIYDALIHKDLYLVAGDLVMGAVLLMVGNLVADLLLAWADPRIRYD